MATYKKKMIEIDAFQYDGDLKGSDGKYYVPDWAVNAYERGILYYDSQQEKNTEPCELYTKQPDGEVVHIPVGYYIIRWSDTELYPCEPALFEASYTPDSRCNEALSAEIAMEYGYEAQSRQLIEEMAELTQAINKHWRIGNGYLKTKSKELRQEVLSARDHIAEELADVQIMIWQMSFLLGSNHGELELIIGNKIDRQLERIEKRSAESGGDAK